MPKEELTEDFEVLDNSTTESMTKERVNDGSPGRPSVMTDETVSRLEVAFASGASDKEACYYAQISKSALYNYQKNNPEWKERKERLKQRPVLRARRNIINAIDEERAQKVKKVTEDGRVTEEWEQKPTEKAIEISKWYLESHKKNEFSKRTEHTGADGESLLNLADLYDASKKAHGKDSGEE